MLARRPLPADFDAWNEQWHAPMGRALGIEAVLPRRVRRRLDRIPRFRGPFGYQPNHSTREFEYPWAYSEIRPSPGMKAVDVGGGNTGLQFVLSKKGVDVTNVDPGEGSTGIGWPVDQSTVARLNKAFGTDVELVGSTLQDAELPERHFDVVYSISTIEHIPADEHESLMSEIRRILVPGGKLVLTVDLFLDLEPFSDRVENMWGANADVAQLVSYSGMKLVKGNRRELLGFPEFDPRAVLADLHHILFGGYPACAQCLVLER